MYALKTKWYQYIEESGKVEISAKGQKLSAAPRIIRDANKVEHIKGVFAKEYGIGDVNRYYLKSEVAFEIPL
jgi:hypothetical protein